MSNLKGVSPVRAEDPYNIQQRVQEMSTPGRKQGGLRSGSLGILPGLNRPIPTGKPSLFEYGNNPGSQSNDSALVQLKIKRGVRQFEEAQRGNRHKSSINKQFNEEVVSPVKQGHIKLDYATANDQKLSANQIVESLKDPNQRYASNKPGYGISNSSLN